MKFLTVCERGEGLPIAMQLAKEGHSSKLMCTDGSSVGKGIVETLEFHPKLYGRPPLLSTVQQISRSAPKDTILIFTQARYGVCEDVLRGKGYLSIGASPFHASLLDEAYAQSVNRMCEIETTPQNMQSVYALEGWFNGEEFLYPIFGLFPEYGFMAGDLGPAIECAGVTGFAFKNFPFKAFSETLGKLTPVLRKMDFRGPVSADICGDAVLRYVPGMRMDFFYLFMQLLEQPLGKLFADLVRGMVKMIRTNFSYGVCVRATMPPFPHQKAEPSGLAIGQDRDLDSGMIPTGLQQMGKDLVIASFSGDAFCTCAIGSSVKEAQAALYQRTAHFVVPNLQFRIDIGALALRNIHFLLQREGEKGNGGKRGVARGEPQTGEEKS